MNVLADALTATRCVLALIILCIGVLQGVEEGLSTIVALTVLSWTTDVLDGPLASSACSSCRRDALSLPHSRNCVLSGCPITPD